jgi:hypothetical protein
MKICPCPAFNGLQVLLLTACRGIKQAAVTGVLFAAVRARAHARVDGVATVVTPDNFLARRHYCLTASKVIILYRVWLKTKL